MQKLLRNTHFWVFIFLLLLSISIFIIYHFSQSQQQSNTAVIYHKGDIIQIIDLSQVKEKQTFIISTENGSNTIAIEPGRICVQEANCSDHVCTQQGWIDNGIYPIVCLPNQLIIRIEGTTEETITNTVDIIAR